MDNSKIAMLKAQGWTDDEITAFTAFTAELAAAVHDRREIPDHLSVRVADIIGGRVYVQKPGCAFAASHGRAK